MALTITTPAVALIRHSMDLAGHDPQAVGVRLRLVGGSVMPRFVEGPSEGDLEIEQDGVRIYVAAALAQQHPDGVIGVSAEHETLVVSDS